MKLDGDVKWTWFLESKDMKSTEEDSCCRKEAVDLERGGHAHGMLQERGC